MRVKCIIELYLYDNKENDRLSFNQLKDELQGELVKVKSGKFENDVTGHIIKVESILK